MIRDLRLHGSIGPVDYFTFVAGANIYNTYFYDEGPSSIRFFSRGNEFTISEEGLRYKGTGGSFCEYMFGVEKPVTDMQKTDIFNRLIMFGAFLDEKDKVVFTNVTEGMETFYRLFLQGHAVKNYYFLISTESSMDYKKRQKHILKSVGKFLKRTDYLCGDKDTELLSSFFAELNEKRSILFIFKLIHRANEEFYNSFGGFYMRDRELTHQEQLCIDEIVLRNGIDSYQQERMKIDIMYRHSSNKVLVDEYRDILIKGIGKEELDTSDHARLNRLRTLSIRNSIPIVLFDTLDDLLLKDKRPVQIEEADYLREARAILENLFFTDTSLKKHIIKEDIVRLIKSKHHAHTVNDRGFEQILLDIGKACDELSLKTEDFSIFEEFSSIVTYFDRYDNVSALLSQLAFMKNVEFSEQSLRSLMGNKKAFDELDGSLFKKVFVNDLAGNKYVTQYGKKKIMLVLKGIENIQAGEASIKDILLDLKDLSDEETLYQELRTLLKKKMRTFFPGLEMKKMRKQVKEEIEQELSQKAISTAVPPRLFEKVFIDLGKESVYVNQILPDIIRNMDMKLREDFLNNSGLDRFYIESLEEEYIEEKGLDASILGAIRNGGESS